jgi:hypothetical protein
MNTASTPPIQAAVSPSELGMPGVSEYERATSAVNVTGLLCAKL